MLFYARFGGQLRRTRPELITSLENAVTASASAAGGSVDTGYKVITASFDEDRTCFWMDILILIKKIHIALEKVASELHGHSFVLGRDIPETLGRKLCRFRTKDDFETTGIWCSEDIRKNLDFYMSFGPSTRLDDISDGYGELLEFRSFAKGLKAYPYREKILTSGKGGKSLALEPEFADRPDGPYQYCKSLLGDIPPLMVRFGAGGYGPICFVDAWTREIRSFISGNLGGTGTGETLEELDAAHALLFRERLRKEWSANTSARCSRFMRSLLSAYIAAVRNKIGRGLLLLENLCLADETAVEIFNSVYSSLDDRKELLVLVRERETFEISKDIIQKLPLDLWETAYTILLLGQYFPVYLLPQLFEEEGLNRDIYFQAQEIFTTLGLFVSDDPRPLVPDFAALAEDALGERKEKINSALRDRILSWAVSGKLRPCFDIIWTLSDLGKRAGDALILQAIRADVLNQTIKSIEEAFAEGQFSSLVGEDNAPILSYIYNTLKALVWGGNEDVQRTFSEELPSMSCYGGFRAQVQTNLTAYYIGSKDIEAASEAVRKAMLLNRDLRENAVPAHRLFALVNLSKQRINDAMEYISFALEQAERTEQDEELFLSCYFASCINFLHGNLSKAKRLAKRAEETAPVIGQPGWGMRAKFFRGRICFDLGSYDEALEIFESLAAGGEARPPDMAHTVQAWIFRTRNFMGRYSLPNDANLTGPDAEIFRIEAAFIDSDYKKTAALAEAFLSSKNNYSANDFFFTERPDWSSGFSQCEYLFQCGKAPGTNFAWIYRTMAQCALQHSQDAKAKILGDMQRFIREELLPDTDPNDSFYFHAWYCMLRDSKDSNNSDITDIRRSHVDINTVVGMALRRLQRRAGRIDDKETKQAFQNLSRWNSALYSAAREYKLL
ncbi:MAG: hypothetical protein FWH19_02750 [Treponema sp.]|nr:hypothetical protein [Treponema sp.]